MHTEMAPCYLKAYGKTENVFSFYCRCSPQGCIIIIFMLLVNYLQSRVCPLAIVIFCMQRQYLFLNVISLVSNENNVCNIHSCIDNATSLYFVMKNLTCQISFDFFLSEFFSAFFFTCRIACSRVASHVLSLHSGHFVLPVQAKNSLCCHGFI